MAGISREVEQSLKKSSWIRKLFDEGNRLKKIHGAEAVFDFSLGNPIVEPPSAFLNSLEEVQAEELAGHHRYIDNQGLISARDKVAEFLNERYEATFSANTIIMTVGAGGGLNVVLKSILDPEDEVIVLTPFFVEYTYYISNHGGKVVYCPLAEDFSIDIVALEQAISKQTKAIIVNTPHNPTGTIFTQQNLDQLGDVLRTKEESYGTHIYMVYDDPYGQLVYDVKPPDPFKAYERTILASSFSKDLGIAGERLGYIGLNQDTEHIDSLIPALVFSNRVLGFVNAPVYMQRVIAKMKDLTVETSEYRQRRDLMIEVLDDAGFVFEKPTGAFYIFPKTPIEDDVAFCQTAAQEFKLLIVPGSGFGRSGHFRLSYSVSIDQINRSKDVFKQLLNHYR